MHNCLTKFIQIHRILIQYIYKDVLPKTSSFKHEDILIKLKFNLKLLTALKSYV